MRCIVDPDSNHGMWTYTQIRDFNQREEKRGFDFFEEIYNQIPDVVKSGTQSVPGYKIFGLTKDYCGFEIRVPVDVYNSWERYHL